MSGPAGQWLRDHQYLAAWATFCAVAFIIVLLVGMSG